MPEARATTDAVRLDILRSLESFLCCEADLTAEVIVVGVIGVNGRGVGVEAAAEDLDRDVEAQDILPLRVCTIVLRLVGVVPV